MHASIKQKFKVEGCKNDNKSHMSPFNECLFKDTFDVFPFLSWFFFFFFPYKMLHYTIM